MTSEFKTALEKCRAGLAEARAGLLNAGLAVTEGSDQDFAELLADAEKFRPELTEIMRQTDEFAMILRETCEGLRRRHQDLMKRIEKGR